MGGVFAQVLEQRQSIFCSKFLNNTRIMPSFFAIFPLDKIKPKIVIAADGVNSTVANALNLIKERKCSFAHITSFEMSNVKIANPHLEQIFFDDFAPKGFAYIFRPCISDFPNHHSESL